MLKHLFYNFFLFIEKNIGNAKIYSAMRLVTLGPKSQIYPEARIVNMKGGQGNIVIGRNTHLRGELMTMNYGGQIHIGDHSFLGEGSRIWSGESVKIGSHVLISHNVNIFDTDSHELDYLERSEGYINLIKSGQPKSKGSIRTAPVIIEDHVWINFNVIILKGVTIGKGSILAAGCVVTNDIPAYSLVAGNPGRVVKQLNFEA